MTDETPAAKHPRDMTQAERAAGIRKIERDRATAIDAIANNKTLERLRFLKETKNASS